MRQVALVTYCMTVWTFSTKSAGNMRGTCWDSEIWPPKPTVIAIYGCCWNCFFKRPLTTRKQEDPAHIPNLDIFGGFWWHFWSPYDFPQFPHGFPMVFPCTLGMSADPCVTAAWITCRSSSSGESSGSNSKASPHLGSGWDLDGNPEFIQVAKYNTEWPPLLSNTYDHMLS